MYALTKPHGSCRGSSGSDMHKQIKNQNRDWAAQVCSFLHFMSPIVDGKPQRVDTHQHAGCLLAYPVPITQRCECFGIAGPCMSLF